MQLQICVELVKGERGRRSLAFLHQKATNSEGHREWIDPDLLDGDWAVEFGRKLARQLIFQQRRRDQDDDDDKRNTIATSQIAILRVRGWCAILFARPRSSVILEAICPRENKR